MTCKVLNTIRKYQMLDGVSTLCVGVSGGADSVALLHLLLSIQEQFGFSVRVVHVNHHLRCEESDRDAAFVQKLCDDSQIPCTVKDFDVAQIAKERKQSVELCGRELRYQAFRSLGCDAIAVAHTLSDSIETAMFHLARGTSLKGASGIPPKNEDIIRPLIECTRTEIEEYIRKNDIPYITDSTNLTDDYARNYIRHNVIPPLSERFQAFESCFSRFMNNAALAQDYLEQSAKELKDSADTDKGFALDALQAAHPAVLQCFLRELLANAMSKPVEEDHIVLCLSAVQSGSGKVQIGADLYFEIRQGYALITQSFELFDWTVEVEEIGAPVQTPYGTYRVHVCKADERQKTDRRHWIDPNNAHSPLVLRSRLPGHVFHSQVRKQSKLLKKLFNEMKLPPDARCSTALLACNNDAKSVIWVENVGADAAFQADKTTDPVWIICKERNAERND